MDRERLKSLKSENLATTRTHQSHTNSTAPPADAIRQSNDPKSHLYCPRKARQIRSVLPNRRRETWPGVKLKIIGSTDQFIENHQNLRTHVIPTVALNASREMEQDTKQIFAINSDRNYGSATHAPPRSSGVSVSIFVSSTNAAITCNGRRLIDGSL
jgi:hypothetical protein